jgi:hypothetical protein
MYFDVAKSDHIKRLLRYFETYLFRLEYAYSSTDSIILIDQTLLIKLESNFSLSYFDIICLIRVIMC